MLQCLTDILLTLVTKVSTTAISFCLSRIQQSKGDSAPAHSARDTIYLSGRHRPSLVLASGHQIVQIWTPSTTRSGESCTSAYINVV